ncbi:MAG: hypothetical protein SR1Q7_05620 [Quinella sp. 1Q7]|nr:hypothetical protein [Quinella sp. 1Q7]MBR2734291.1 hypothetical protein [Selenomonadaceae bacterium]
MKNFFVALTVALILSASNIAAAETALFTEEQFDKIVAHTVANPAASEAATLNLDAATFQRNYNAFITNFIRETSAQGDDAAMMERIFLLNDAKTFENDSKQVFTKNFANRAVIIGFNEAGGNFKVLNFFATIAEDRDDALFNVLVLQGFLRGIDPTLNAGDLLNEAQKDPSKPVIRNGVKFSVATIENINIITAVAAQ